MKQLGLILLSIALGMTGARADDKVPFKPGPIESYPNHQTLDKITIAAVPFITDEQTKTAFGKLNPTKYGVVAVLVLLKNDTGKTLRLDLQTEYVDVGNRHIEATPASDIIYVGQVVKRPRMPGASPIPLPSRNKPGPMNTPEITTRAFAAKMLLDGETASGFFYFQTQHIPGSKLYLNGIKDAATGKDFFYFEIPFEKPAN